MNTKVKMAYEVLCDAIGSLGDNDAALDEWDEVLTDAQERRDLLEDALEEARADDLVGEDE